LKLTRREALAVGAAAGVTAGTTSPGTAFAAAVAGFGDGPEYLRRSTYAPLVGEVFFAAGHALTLVAVGDVQGAQFDRSLQGREDAFTLEWTGPADALDDSIHELTHPALGPFPLFLGPFGEVRGAEQSYCAVVDRTVKLGAATPPREADPSPAPVYEPDPDVPLSERDREIVEERLMAIQTPRVMQRRRTRRARARLRRTLDARIRFKRKQAFVRRRLRRALLGWRGF
jgi:hypothetical protein